MHYRKKKNTVIAILFACILTMSVGYAIWADSVRVEGTAKLDQSISVRITNIESKAIGFATNKEEPTFTDATATFNTDLVSPDDRMEYTITLKNFGVLDAIAENITFEDSENENIIYKVSGLVKGNVIKSFETYTFKFIVEFKRNNDNATSKSKTTTLKLDFVQKEGSSITEVAKPITADDIKALAVTTGDGLYADEYEEGRYIYKGTAPNNYITFNSESWRIVSIENDGTIKIIRNVQTTGKFDDGSRTIDNNSYCTSTTGCNAWAATANLKNRPLTFTLYGPNSNPSTDTTIYSGTVTEDAMINNDLNTTYYNETLGEDKQYIISHDFYVGSPGASTDEEDMTTNIEQEKQYIWNGKVGLINVTDTMRTTTAETCTTIKSGYAQTGKLNSNCVSQNWILSKLASTSSNKLMLTINPHIDSNRVKVWVATSLGLYDNINTSTGNFLTTQVYPVVYLMQDLQLQGEGSSTNPYVIVG